MKCLTLLFLFVFSATSLATASINVGTYNIRNFGSNTDKNLLKDIILESSPDLLSVQEIVDASSFRYFVKKELPGYEAVLSKCGGGGGQKLGFLYNKRTLRLISAREDDRLETALSDRCGSLRPAMIGIFEELQSSKTFAAISVHLKAGSGSRTFSRRARQYQMVYKIMNELENAGQRNILAMGDFNTTGYDPRNVDYQNFKKMLDQTGARTSADKTQCTSYWTGRDRNDGIEEASTLDHVVYTENFLGATPTNFSVGGHCKAAACEDVYEDILGESYRSVSDHCPVTLSFN